MLNYSKRAVYATQETTILCALKRQFQQRWVNVLQRLIKLSQSTLDVR